MNATVRLARREDVAAMLAIYNHEVENGTATFDIHPQSLQERMAWFEAHDEEAHPILVALEDGEVVGYASLSAYRSKEAYAGTAELSVYVAPGARGRGVGSGLTQAVLDFAREKQRIHCVVSVITSTNAASAAMHARFGFTYCGRTPEVGLKFGRYLSTDTYALIL